MLRKVKEYVQKWHMIEKGDKVIVGVSGGADSVCLLFVLLELQKTISFDIIVVHVNHGLRGEDANQDENYVKKFCKEKNILCVCYFENVELIAKNRKQSTEEAGREVRRAAFRKTMELYGGTKIALAHHKNDNAETMLLNLARGTGLKGLGGMHPIVDCFIRPLLCVERSEIEQFLQEEHIDFRIDATNACDDYTRNRLRNHLIPYLVKEVNPRSVSHINETMEQLREIQAFMEEQKNMYFQQCVKLEKECCIILEDSFLKMPKVFQPLVLKETLVKIAGKEKDLSVVHIEALQELFLKQVGKKKDFPYEIQADRVYDGIRIQKKISKKTDKIYACLNPIMNKVQKIQLGDKIVNYRIFEVEETSSLINKRILENSGTKWFDYDIIENGVSIRTRQAGDYITIHVSGKTQKIKSYFINEKIPQDKRDDILILADGAHVLWIVGYRTNCMYHVSQSTKRVLEVEVRNLK